PLVTDDEFNLATAAVALQLGKERDLDVITQIQTDDILRKAEVKASQLLDEKLLIDLGKKNSADWIVFGTLTAKNTQLLQYNIRSLELDLMLGRTRDGAVVNKLHWSMVLWNAQQWPADLEGMTRSAVTRVIWRGPDLYPVNVVVNSTRKRDYAAEQNQVRKLARDELRAMQFPGGTEVESVNVNVRENKSVAPTGIIGCITLVGWIFLPYYQVETNVDVTVRVHVLEGKELKNYEYKRDAKDSSYYHLFTWDSGSRDLTDKMLKSLIADIKTQLKAEPALFIQRPGVLDGLKQGSAP
ncbi:MAG: hypothetical protein HY042_07705, partial [Spirochaetia bacterium]|nr:hypothetical protein [Spirochaetia bacterium]